MSRPHPVARSLPRRCALAAAGWLVIGGIVIPFALAYFAGLTGLESSPPEYSLAAIIVLTGTTVAGGAFGRQLAEDTGVSDVKRMTWAGALSYGPAAIIAGMLLGFGEPAAFRAVQSLGIPIHVLFGMMFVTAVFAVVAVTGLAFGRALRNGRVGVELALKAGLAAAVAFLAADVIQDLLGRRVGGPNAAASATMLTVALVGVLAAAAAAGAVMGSILRRHAERSTISPPVTRASDFDGMPATTLR